MSNIISPRALAEKAPGALLAAVLAGLAAWGPSAAQAKASDCPQATTGYSSRMALLDLLLDPRAAAILEDQGVLKGLPPALLTPKAPSFAAIVSPEWLLTQSPFKRQEPAAAIAALDKALSGLAVTPDQTRLRCARYDQAAPVLPRPTRRPAILVFEKINGFRDAPSMSAAHQAFVTMGARRGWDVAFTDNGAAFEPSILRRYDAVVWNNVSGDALTTAQRKAFKAYIEAGGGFVGVHGSGGDPVYWWDWYRDKLIGARFIGHPMAPQLQPARVEVEPQAGPLADGLQPRWTMTEEWYSFAASPRLSGARIIVSLAESTYKPGAALRMGDHPLAWTRCLSRGRAFYTAIGHSPAAYEEANSARLLENGVAWAAGLGATRCQAGREIARD
jgi:uncharacterized protein